MFGQNVIRVAAAALVLSTLSFAVGVAGDLAEPPTSGTRVVLRIPPELPADTPRAAPLPPRIATASAAAAEVPRAPRQLRVETPVTAPVELAAPLAKPKPVWFVASGAKPDPDRGPKPEIA